MSDYTTRHKSLVCYILDVTCMDLLENLMQSHRVSIIFAQSITEEVEVRYKQLGYMKIVNAPGILRHYIAI